MKFTLKTYERLLRRMEVRIFILRWSKRFGGNPEEIKRRINRERKLARGLMRRAIQNLTPEAIIKNHG